MLLVVGVKERNIEGGERRHDGEATQCGKFGSIDGVEVTLQ